MIHAPEIRLESTSGSITLTEIIGFKERIERLEEK